MDFMEKANEYMKTHQFTRADICKVRNWVNSHRTDKIKDVVITRDHISIINCFGSEFQIQRTALGIGDNYA